MIALPVRLMIAFWIPYDLSLQTKCRFRKVELHLTFRGLCWTIWYTVGTRPSGCGAWMRQDYTFQWWESIKHVPLERGLGSFSCRSKPAMVSTFPSCVVCSCCTPVVFAFVVTKVGLNIKMFTWMTDHTIVMTAFRLCCFYSALFCTTRSLCCKLPSQSNSADTSLPVFQECSRSLPFSLLSPSCISTFTGNYSHGGLKQYSV